MLRPRLHLARLLFHPLVQLRFLEAPAVAQLEGRNLLFPNVLVKRVRTHSQVLRRLAYVHHFSRVGHVSLPQFLASPPEPFPLPVSPARGAYLETSALQCLSGGSRCPEHISALKSPAWKRISVFCWVLCPFLGIRRKTDSGVYLYVVVFVLLCPIRGSFQGRHRGSLANW